MVLRGALRDQFFAQVLERDAAQVKAAWSRQLFSGRGLVLREAADVQELKKALAANPALIACVDKSAVDASLKVIYGP